MKPDRAPIVIRMDASDSMDSPRRLALPWDDSKERHIQLETSNLQDQAKTRAKYRPMVSLLNAIEENSPTTRSLSCSRAKEASIGRPADGDFTNSELSRTARDYDETLRRCEIEQIADFTRNVSKNRQVVAKGDYLLDSNLSVFYENVTPDRKTSSVTSEHQIGRHLNSHGALSIPASLENLRVDHDQVVCLNRRSRSLSGDLNSDSVSPSVSGPSSYSWLSESKEPDDNREVSCIVSAQQQCTINDSERYGRHRHGSGYSSGSLSVCSEGGSNCKIVGNGSSSAPVEMRPWSGAWVSEYDEHLSGLDVVLFRPLGTFDPDVEEDETPIVSSRGTVRGMRNKVKVGIATFDDTQNTCKASHDAHSLTAYKFILLLYSTISCYFLQLNTRQFVILLLFSRQNYSDILVLGTCIYPPSIVIFGEIY